jgi:glycosyltransferase involved in cell wall biosynthesis
MKVSYLITSRNRREELLETLASCRQQTYPDKEVHVVDDGSTDGTFVAVRS